jgi:small-conductance mechanosensitive channel
MADAIAQFVLSFEPLLRAIPGSGGVFLQAATGTNASVAGRPLAPIINRQDLVPGWVLLAAVSILVLAVGWVVAQFLTRLTRRRIARRLRRPSLTNTALRGIRLSVLLVSIFVVLWLTGVNLGNIALSVGVFSAVLGVVLAPIVGSLISGIFLLADQPYEIGDMIELAENGKRGFVEDITLRYTKIFTLDNSFLVIPNGTMRDRDVINYSAEDTRVRLSREVLITYESDVPAARSQLERAAAEIDGVIEGGPDIRIGSARYPAAPTCHIKDFADHGILLALRYWAKEPYQIRTVESAVNTRIWDRIADVDVEIAYPHSHLVFDETSGEMQVAMTKASANGRETNARHARADETADSQ